MWSSRSLLRMATLVGLAWLVPAAAMAAEPLKVYAAGSTRKALTEAAQSFTAKEGREVRLTFGASGLLLDRLRGGEAADLYAPADLTDAWTLHRAGLASPVVRFARSRLCVVTRGGRSVTPAAVLDMIGNPSVRIMAPAPSVDATGIYVWRLYRRAERLRPGSYRLLDDKTVRLDPRIIETLPPGKSALAVFFERDMADLLFAYCNSAGQAAAEAPELKVTELPPDLAVPVAYGITILAKGDRTSGRRFIDFLLSAEGQAIIAKWGFAPP